MKPWVPVVAGTAIAAVLLLAAYSFAPLAFFYALMMLYLAALASVQIVVEWFWLISVALICFATWRWGFWACLATTVGLLLLAEIAQDWLKDPPWPTPFERHMADKLRGSAG